MNVELNAFVVIDDWQAVVNRTVANYFDSLGFEHLDQILDMRVFDLLNMNLLDAVRVEEIIVCLYRSLNPNITVDEAMYCGAMNQCFDYTGWRKIHRQLEKITVRDLVLTENINLRAIQHFYDAIRKKFFKSKEYALISSRSDGHGCPYCEDHKLLKGFNDFASQYPQLAKEWSEKNKVGADAVTSSKAGLFWWHCPSCGGEYSAWISSRIDGSRCPYCAGRVVEENLNSLSKTHPAIAVEWNYEKNGTITPDQVSALSKQEYWWKSSCGHEWKAKVYDRTVRKVPCPKCEQEFVYVLPQLLVMLYTGQNHLKVEFDTDDLTGIRMEMYIPELNLAIEERSTDERNHEQKVKRYICELQDVRYILYEPFKSAEDAVAFIRTILKEHHVHIKTAAADDIALCREKYNLLKRRKLR